MEVAVLTVGDELLSGRTANDNATWLCRELTDLGARVVRVVVVPDEVDVIAEELSRLRNTVDRVIVTGGIGPTHDDVTLDAVAAAHGREMEQNDRAYRWLLEEGGYAAEDLVEGTAALPSGATPIHNDVGVAPGAYLEGVYVFPGVPEEMRAMFHTVAEDFEGRVLHREEVAIDEPESALLGRLAELRDRFDVSVGSYPGEHVVVRITGTDRAAVLAAAEWLADRAEIVSPADVPDPGDGNGDTHE